MSDEITPTNEAQPDAPAVEQDTTPENAEALESESSTDETAEDGPKKSKGVQKRIDELTKNWRDTERDRDHWRELALEKLKEDKTPDPMPQAAPAAPVVSNKPTLDQFDYDQEAYLEALTDWKIETRRAAEVRASEEAKAREAQAERARTVSERLDKYDAENPGAKAAILAMPRSVFPDHVAEYAAESEHGIKIAHHLASNPEVASHIASLPPNRALVELGKIEARFESAPTPKPRQQSNAPAPAPTLGGTAPVAKDPAKMTMKEFVAWRKANSTDPNWQRFK